MGDFNLANLALAVGMAVARGLAADAIVARRRRRSRRAGAAGARAPTTRGVLCVVDYAHTPDALERAIARGAAAGAPGG